MNRLFFPFGPWIGNSWSPLQKRFLARYMPLFSLWIANCAGWGWVRFTTQMIHQVYLVKELPSVTIKGKREALDLFPTQSLLSHLPLWEYCQWHRAVFCASTQYGQHAGSFPFPCPESHRCLLGVSFLPSTKINRGNPGKSCCSNSCANDCYYGFIGRVLSCATDLQTLRWMALRGKAVEGLKTITCYLLRSRPLSWTTI